MSSQLPIAFENGPFENWATKIEVNLCDQSARQERSEGECNGCHNYIHDALTQWHCHTNKGILITFLFCKVNLIYSNEWYSVSPINSRTFMNCASHSGMDMTKAMCSHHNKHQSSLIAILLIQTGQIPRFWLLNFWMDRSRRLLGVSCSYSNTRHVEYLLSNALGGLRCMGMMKHTASLKKCKGNFWQSR